MLLQVVADGIGVLGSDLKKSLPVVADEKGIFRTTSKKKCKKNSAQVGQNFEN